MAAWAVPRDVRGPQTQAACAMPARRIGGLTEVCAWYRSKYTVRWPGETAEYAKSSAECAEERSSTMKLTQDVKNLQEAQGFETQSRAE